MMDLLRNLWNDESGYVLTSEAVLVGTVAVVGGTVGLNTISHSVNEELVDVAKAIRSLDQSYCVSGFSGCGSCTSGSSFTQRSVDESLAEIDLIVEEGDKTEGKKAKHRHKHDSKMDRKKREEGKNRHSDDDHRKKSRKQRKRMELNHSETKKGGGVSPLRKNEFEEEIF